MAKVLLVDDDQDLMNSLSKFLTGQGHVVESAICGGDAVQLLRSFNFDVIVLDWQLGDMSGPDICKRFRRDGGNTPILMLTGLSTIDNKEEGLESGADDYLVKPFDVRELNARLKTLLRRPGLLTSTNLEARGVSLEIETRTVSHGTDSVKLTQRESALLEFLMRHPNRTFSTAMIRDSVWPLDSEGAEGTVRTCMRTLRVKLEKIGQGDLIRTDFKSGYIISTE